MDTIQQKRKDLETYAGEYGLGGGSGRNVGMGGALGGAAIIGGAALAAGGSQYIRHLGEAKSTEPGGIVDRTSDNIEIPIQQQQTQQQQTTKPSLRESDWYKLYKEEQQHLEERQDTAWQRTVKDARAAGINPNLMNLSPAASGNVEMTPLSNQSSENVAEYQGEIELLKQIVEQNFQGDQKTKDRLMNFVGDISQIVAMMSIAKK